jgi:hypothetical protein
VHLTLERGHNWKILIDFHLFPSNEPLWYG